MDTTKEALFKKVEARRGFRFGLHDFLAEVWPEFLTKIDDYVQFVYLRRDGLLDRKTREMCLIAALCAAGDDLSHIELHVRAAAAAGVTPEEILEELALISYWIGGARYPAAFEVWRRVFRPDLPTILQVTKEPTAVE